MDSEDLLEHIDKLLKRAEKTNLTALFPQTAEFLRRYTGPDSVFYASALACDPRRNNNHDYYRNQLILVVSSFRDYVEAGLHSEISPERQAQLDVVSDFLGMSEELLGSKDFHPAAAAVLIGATLEEFLRTWVEDRHLSIGGKKPGVEVYSQVLREAGLITKQDGKDITSWAGIRNHAAHGEWDEVGDKKRIRLMLEGVNLFMRTYSS